MLPYDHSFAASARETAIRAGQTAEYSSNIPRIRIQYRVLLCNSGDGHILLLHITRETMPSDRNTGETEQKKEKKIQRDSPDA